MAQAEVGDDVFGEDPSIRRLEETTAALLEKEAALFVTSGTLSNQIALLLHTRPGDEVILGQGAHIANSESGAGAALSGVQFAAVGSGGLFDAEDVAAAVRPQRDWLPRTRLIALENTHNLGGGRVFPDDQVRRITDLAGRLGLALHLDGARLWNAAVATGLTPAALAREFDTVSVCFSKGLGAPVGSALVGSRELIRAGRRFRKMLGGGMRQGGILAAGALFALEHHRERLAEDHENARLLAGELAGLRGAGVEAQPPETNIVLLRCTKGDAEVLAGSLAQAGVLASAMDRQTLRLVTHLDVSRDDVLEAARRVGRALARGNA